jgi:cytochrome c oxidase subunit I
MAGLPAIGAGGGYAFAGAITERVGDGGGVSAASEHSASFEAGRGARRRPVASTASWLTSTDHKKIGVLYCVTAFVFFLIGGALAGAMRLELAQPGLQYLSRQAYDGLFTIHGTTMIFLFVAPFATGLANYMVPLQIGAPDMAFPRLNLLSYWFFGAGGLLVMLSGFAASGGGAAMGWYAYPPLSEIRYSPGVGPDLWILGLALVAVSSLLAAVNILSTVFLLRAPGMTMWRLPIFTWNMVVTSMLAIAAFPPAVAAFSLLLVDRRLGGHAFDPLGGGDPIVYQHLFWFLGHPEVYILILPFFGVITEIIPVFSRKPLFGYVGFVLATLAIGALSTGVWAHHMFTTGAVDNPFFAAVTLAIAVPTGVKFFNWIGSMWGGKLSFETPMLFSIGFLLNFLIGGVTGVMLASPPIDFQVADTYFLIAHFHYTMVGGSVFGIFAAIYFWFPKMTGKMLRESLGRVVFVLLFVGFNITFWPQFVLGLRGMPRRVADYPSGFGFTTPNLVSTLGWVVMSVGVLVFLADVWISLRRPVEAGDDPWDGYSLEWATSSPPPENNFDELVPIRSVRPAFDAHHGQAQP